MRLELKLFAICCLLIISSINVSLTSANTIVPYNSYLNFLASLSPRETRLIRDSDSPIDITERDEIGLPDSSSSLSSDILLRHEPNLRDQEYIEHSSLFGHQYVTGGAGEGIQRLKPDGSIPNIQVIKTDSVLPAYCNPPNPCPPGYTEEDGCIEDFTNTATFSRDFQAQQQCICDTEHMFDCPGSSDDSDLDTLARTIQNNGLSSDTVERIADAYTHNSIDGIDTASDANGGRSLPIYYSPGNSGAAASPPAAASDSSPSDDSHRVVAKKFFSKRTSPSNSPMGSFSSFERSKKREVLQGNHQIHHVKNFPWNDDQFTPQVMAKKSPIYAIPF